MAKIWARGPARLQQLSFPSVFPAETDVLQAPAPEQHLCLKLLGTLGSSGGMWDLLSTLPFPGLLSLADMSGVLNLSLDFSSVQQKTCMWIQESGFVLILPALSEEMTRKQRCGSFETFLGSCPSSSMQPVGQQLKAASPRALFARGNLV